jgi:predicted NBD/HSP70 family sugar kinase
MKQRIEPTLLRKINERRVLEILHEQGPSSRAAVTRASGMSAPTVSKAVASLIDSGLLEEHGEPVSTLGRPSTLLRLAVEKACVIGVVIDAHQSWVLSAGMDGKIHEEQMACFDTPATYAALMRTIERKVQKVIESTSGKALGVGISVPGLVNKRVGEVVFSPNAHQLDGQRPADDLTARLGVDCLMFQESHALCLGERRYGAAKGHDNFAMLDVSTGLGLGVISGGKLLVGHSGLAGELGHLTVDPNGAQCGCGNRGCLETLATDSALARLISIKRGRATDIEQALTAIRSGRLDATKELETVCEYLAIAAAAVINIFNPSTLFLHGRLFEASDDLFARTIARTRKRALAPSLADCNIVQARGSKRQGAIASIIHHLTHAWGPALS